MMGVGWGLLCSTGLGSVDGPIDSGKEEKPELKESLELDLEDHVNKDEPEEHRDDLALTLPIEERHDKDDLSEERANDDGPDE
jgi:hypothetical protein